MILVDTGFFFALASANDPHHERAREVLARFKGQDLPRLLLTTNHVVAEAITLTQVKIGHDAAVEMGQQLHSENSHASTGRHRTRRGRRSPTSHGTATRAIASSTA